MSSYTVYTPNETKNNAEDVNDEEGFWECLFKITKHLN